MPFRFMLSYCTSANPMAVQSKAYVCGSKIAGSNRAEGRDVRLLSLVCCVRIGTCDELIIPS